MKHRKILLIIVPTLLLITALSYHFYSAKSALKDTGAGRLVGWWTMDTNDLSPTGAILYDKSGFNNNGTVTGTTTSTGRLGQAKNFNSTGYIAVTTGASLNFGTGAFTISTWIKPTVIDLNLPRISGRNAFTFDFAYYNGQLAFYDGGWHSNTGVYAPINQWSHVVITRSGSNYVLYSNGVGTTIAGNNPTVTGNLFIGSDFGTTSNWPGQIDDFRIYNYALSAQEVSQLYNSAKTTYTASAPKTASSTAQLVGWWTMDTNDLSPTGAKMYDRSGNNNTGTVTGTTTSTGKIGQARSFNGSSDWINAGASAGNYTNNFTLSAWVKTGGNGASTARIMGRRAGGGTQYDFYSAGTNGLSLYTGVDYNSLVSIEDNKWHLAIVVINGASSKFYVDGVQAGNAFSPTITSQSVNFEIGSIFSGTAGIMNGSIDDVRIYNYALSAQDVSNLYNSAKTKYTASAPKEGLVGWWTMDANDMSPTGATMVDRSGRNNTGTVTGTTTSTGRINQARSFNASTDNVNLGTPSIFNFTATSPFTVSVWASYRGSGGRTMLSRNTGGNTRFVFGYNSWVIRDASAGTWNDVPASIALSFNTWHLLTWVYDGSSNVSGMKLYCDGTYCMQGGDTALSGNLYNAATTVYIAYKNDASDTFNGLLDDIRVYNRALSALEVSNLYQSAKKNHVQ